MILGVQDRDLIRLLQHLYSEISKNVGQWFGHASPPFIVSRGRCRDKATPLREQCIPSFN
jgi:hypothetical protein